jgi:hypothetical protein
LLNPANQCNLNKKEPKNPLQQYNNTGKGPKPAQTKANQQNSYRTTIEELVERLLNRPKSNTIRLNQPLDKENQNKST